MRFATLLLALFGFPACLHAEMLDRSRLRLSFEDDFASFKSPQVDGTPHQAGGWTTVYGYEPGRAGDHTLAGNGELQLYVDPQFKGNAANPLGLDPFVQRDGGFAIKATEIPSSLQADAWKYRYASGLLTTRKSFAQQFGYFELRARLPRGKGLWPAFWLLPASGAWPPEIDVMEMLGHDVTQYYGTIHWGKNEKDHPKDGHAIATPDLSADYHNYGVLWTDAEVCWYFDDEKKACSPTPDDMKTPMYMLINLAVGGYWPGNPDSKTVFPAFFDLKYVKAFTIGSP